MLCHNNFFLFNILFVILKLCVNVYILEHRLWQKLSDTFELDLQMVVNHPTWTLGMKLGLSARAMGRFKHSAVFPALKCFLFLSCSSNLVHSRQWPTSQVIWPPRDLFEFLVKVISISKPSEWEGTFIKSLPLREFHLITDFVGHWSPDVWAIWFLAELSLHQDRDFFSPLGDDHKSLSMTKKREWICHM